MIPAQQPVAPARWPASAQQPSRIAAFANDVRRLAFLERRNAPPPSSALRSNAPTKRDIQELDHVVLKAAVALDSAALPIGARGLVVHRYRDGVAFEVEFSEPCPALLTLRPHEIERVG